MHRIMSWIALVCLAGLASPCPGQVIVSNVYENLDTRRALADTPVTLSRVGADGDFTKGITPCINGRKLAAQVDVLRTAPDGSIRHALVSFVIPKLPAGAFYIHVRQDGAPGYDVRTVRPRPLDRGFRMPLYQLPDGTKPPVQPDHAHAPSLGYVAYLLTGEKFYADEASFWASYQMGEWPHKGLRWQGMDRAFG